MKINAAFVTCSLMLISNAQGGLTSLRSSKSTHKTTPSPNDVLAPPVQVVQVPSKSSSSKTDVLVGALGVTSAILPYLGSLTQLLSSNEPSETPNPASEVILQTDQVSRLKRDMVEDLENEIITDSFLNVIFSPFTVMWETATIILDVLKVTHEQGLTELEVPEGLVRSRRSIFDIFNSDTRKDFTSNYGPDLTNVRITLPNHVSDYIIIYTPTFLTELIIT